MPAHCAPWPVKTKTAVGFSEAGRTGLAGLARADGADATHPATAKDVKGRRVRRSESV